MKSVTMRICAALLSLFLLAGCLPVSAAGDARASTVHFLWASPAESTPAETKPISAVQWWYSADDAVYYLFLPAEADTARLQVWFSGASRYAIDGSTVADGAVTGLLTAGNHTVSFDGTAYTLCVMQSANISSMYISTESGSMNYIHAAKGNEETGKLRMVDANGSVIYDNQLNQIKGRGNATWNKPKKPYQIKLSKSTDLIGAGKCKTWVLLANYSERSLIRNKVAYDLANDAGLPNSSESCFVDLYCNNQYMGNYQLCEKVQINDNRVEIRDLEAATEDCNEADVDSYPRFGPNSAVTGSCKGYEIPQNPEDITGGYLLELEYKDRYEGEVSGFVTSRGQPVVIKSPECASREQVAYISGFFQEFEDALYAADGVNPTTGKRYDEYFDLTSLARKYILEEYVKNIDANVTSQFFYKPSDQESTTGFCGPVWDYDNALGNFNGATSTTGIYAAAKKGYTYYFHMLYQQESFLNAVRAEWNSNYAPLIAMSVGNTPATGDTLLRPLSEYYEMLSASAAMNFTYWNILDSVTSSGVDTGRTYEENIAYLKNYMAGRAEYLSSVWQTEDIRALPQTSSEVLAGIPDILQYNGKNTVYAVCSEEGLQKAADLVSAGNSLRGVTLLQTADITLTGSFTPGGANEANAGLSTLNTVFKGTYNGQGYKIYNLQINRPEQNGVGIFAASYQASFLDVHIESGTVTGFNRVAALTGYGDQCTFTRCSNGADIISLGGTDGTAGLAGVARDSAVFVSCFNTGSVTAETAPAGIAGWGQTNITLQNCYNAGTISGTTSAALARTGAALDFSSCYYADGCGAPDICGATGFADAALTDGTLLAALNEGSGVWAAGDSFPLLAPVAQEALVKLTIRYFAEELLIKTSEVYYTPGSAVSLLPENGNFVAGLVFNGQPVADSTVLLQEDGILDILLSVQAQNISSYTGPGSYYISTAAELETLLQLSRERDLTGSIFYIITDINASGIQSSGGTFTGTLNGKFSRITGLRVPLFQSVAKTGDVRKLIFSDSNLTGHGVVAHANAGKISYITTENLVLRGDAPGGIVGENSGLINACATDGYIISSGSAGGIAATNTGSIKNCYNSARIVACQGSAGGIAAASEGTVAHCFNRGMLNSAANTAVAGGALENCSFWDWCAGDPGAAAPLTSAQIADPAFLATLPALYWQAGETHPVLAAACYELGDANGDNRVSIADVVLLLRYLNDLVPAESIDLTAADVTGDGFSMPDVIRIMQYLNGAYDF